MKHENGMSRLIREGLTGFGIFAIGFYAGILAPLTTITGNIDLGSNRAGAWGVVEYTNGKVENLLAANIRLAPRAFSLEAKAVVSGFGKVVGGLVFVEDLNVFSLWFNGTQDPSESPEYSA